MQLRGQCCTLEPGQVLYVPQYWMAHTQLMDDNTISLVVRLDSRAKLRAPECIALQVPARAIALLAPTAHGKL